MNCDTPCPKYENAMRVLGKKWTCLILRCLLAEPRRFTEISGYIDGLSDRLLSQRLQELEEEGIVQRRVFDRRPVVVEYSLTPKGQAFREVAQAIQVWADEWAGRPPPYNPLPLLRLGPFRPRFPDFTREALMQRSKIKDICQIFKNS